MKNINISQYIIKIEKGIESKEKTEDWYYQAESYLQLKHSTKD